MPPPGITERMLWSATIWGCRGIIHHLIINPLQRSRYNKIFLNTIAAVSTYLPLYIVNYNSDKQHKWSKLAKMTLLSVVFFQLHQWWTGYKLYPLTQSVNKTFRIFAFHWINDVSLQIGFSIGEAYLSRSVTLFAFMFFTNMLVFPINYIVLNRSLKISLFAKQIFINISCSFLSGWLLSKPSTRKT